MAQHTKIQNKLFILKVDKTNLKYEIFSLNFLRNFDDTWCQLQWGRFHLLPKTLYLCLPAWETGRRTPVLVRADLTATLHSQSILLSIYPNYPSPYYPNMVNILFRSHVFAVRAQCLPFTISNNQTCSQTYPLPLLWALLPSSGKQHEL